MTDIRGRVAVVTGGGSGIGRGLALALAAEGAAVAIADILPDPARAVAEEIKASGGSAVSVVCDVSDRESVRRMKAEATAALGDVSLLFANAGATSFERLIDMAENDLDWIVQVNFMGVANCLKIFLDDMVKRGGGGHVCATASVAGLMAGWVPNHCIYSGAKLGVVGLMMNLRMELEEFNIGSTVYCPGGVASGMGANNSSYRPNRFGGPVYREIVTRKDWKGPKAYTPEQIAPAVLLAVKNNRAIVLDHSGDQRELFQTTYVDPVMSAFDDIENYRKTVNWD